MSRDFAVVNRNTGAIDGEYPKSGFYSVPDDYDIALFDIDHPNYQIIELSRDEARIMTYLEFKIEREGKEIIVSNVSEIREGDIVFPALAKYVINMRKARMTIAERDKIDVPIEIEGIGGKEIIGFDKKPESIIIERTSNKEGSGSF